MGTDDGRADGDRSPAGAGAGSGDAFRIDVLHPTSRVVVLRVAGNVDLWTSFPLMESLIAAHAERPELIAVDLSGVRSMDAAGLRTLEEGARHLKDGSVHFAVVSPSSHELACFPQLAGLHRELNVNESTQDAIESWLDEVGRPPTGA